MTPKHHADVEHNARTNGPTDQDQGPIYTSTQEEGVPKTGDSPMVATTTHSLQSSDSTPLSMLVVINPRLSPLGNATLILKVGN